MPMQSEEQGDLFQSPVFSIAQEVLDWCFAPPLFLIGCGRQKTTGPTAARDLYTSTRFAAATKLVEALGAPWFVISGKHGLLPPDQIVEPYDLDLKQLSQDDIRSWADRVIRALPKDADSICVLSEHGYSDPIVTILAQKQELRVVRPLEDVDFRYHEGWLNQALKICARRTDLLRFYDAALVARRQGKLFPFPSLSKTRLPTKGVYVFFDPYESNFRGDPLRIVRIGTHAVSEGSKSTLKTRLRNHLGQSDNSGSHRGSVFRLHVGRAMLTMQDGIEDVPSWGSGQHASRDIRATEIEHERRVSRYMERLEVLIIPADDPSNKHSLRADIERQLIGLCSENFQCVDRPSDSWLGNWSPVDAIRLSGLWNIRDVGSVYEKDARGSVTQILKLLGAS